MRNFPTMTPRPAATAAPLDTLLTVAEVAEYLRVSEMTVYRLITNREIGATKVGRGWRIRASDLSGYLDQRHVPRAS